jgi:uncharacterized protein (DUF1778 family)
MLENTDMAKQTARLEARVPEDVHALLKRAAEIEGRTLTDFVISAASSAALETVEKAEIIRLSGRSAEMLTELIANPPPMNDAMRRAHEHRARLLGEA